MSKCVLLKVRGDDQAYLVDIASGLVSPVDCDASDVSAASRSSRDLDFAAVVETRAAAASYPFFTDP